MFEVTCWDSYDRVIEGFTQWDINQTLHIKDIYDDFGLTEAPMFHFCNQKSKEALVVQSTIEKNNVVVVKVPNILLQEGLPLFAYMYVYSIPPEKDGDTLADVISSASAKTLIAIKLPVRPRVKPSHYKYIENIDSLTVAQIEEKIKNRLDALESELRDSVDSKMSELEELILELEEWLSNSGISSTSSYITTNTYEVVTDSNRKASLPITLKDNQLNYVFINGLLAVDGKDYQIVDKNIQLTSSEFTSGNDVVTFVVLESVIDGKTGESKPINILSEVYETKTNTEGYSILPFTFNNQVFQVFINGVLAKEDTDYSIVDDNGGIQIENSELILGDDIVTFVVLQEVKNEETSDNKSIIFSSEVYEVITDKSGCATIPLVPKIMLKNYDNKVIQVFINGMYAIANKDYLIENGNIQLTDTELGFNDVITFIVFKVTTENNSTNEEHTNLKPITEEELDEICV